MGGQFVSGHPYIESATALSDSDTILNRNSWLFHCEVVPLNFDKQGWCVCKHLLCESYQSEAL